MRENLEKELKQLEKMITTAFGSEAHMLEARKAYIQAELARMDRKAA